VPTLNAAGCWKEFHAGLRQQAMPLQQVIVLDSTSTDGTPELARAAGYTVVTIPRHEFNHGGTRQVAAEMLPGVDVLVYLTQDAVLQSPDALGSLVTPFQDAAVGAAYGRQLPRPDANAIEAHARLFNYPETGQVKTLGDRETMGIKAAFLSNSFAAYRRTALQAVGGFPVDTIVAEDALVAAKLLMAGWKTSYVAEATVLHSHPYGVAEEFARYFDTGVYHSREPWLLETFGGAHGEGKRFVLSELRYLLHHAPYLVPSALVRTVAKYAGYHLGRNEARLDPALRRRLSLHKRFWDSEAHS
jgi:rhamnosyltransferase